MRIILREDVVGFVMAWYGIGQQWSLILPLMCGAA